MVKEHYEYYVKVMKKAVLDHEILPPNGSHTSQERQQASSKNFLFKLYMLGFMILTVFLVSIMWKMTFAHTIEEYHAEK